MEVGAFSFGQFLIAEGVVNSDDIRRALDLMERQNPRLGDLAVAEGLMTDFDAQRVAQLQRQSHQPFGDACVALGLLTVEDADVLARRQADASIGLGEALVQVGVLDDECVAELLQAFDRIADRFLPVDPVLPEELVGVRIAEILLELIPRYVKRYGQIEASVERTEVADVDSDSFQANLTIRGNPGIIVTLLTERSLARCIALGILGFDSEDLDGELIEDGLAEFLNVVAGNTTAMLDREGIEVAVDPPEPGIAGPEGTPFRIVSLRGQGILQVEKKPV